MKLDDPFTTLSSSITSSLKQQKNLLCMHLPLGLLLVSRAPSALRSLEVRPPAPPRSGTREELQGRLFQLLTTVSATISTDDHQVP